MSTLEAASIASAIEQSTLSNRQVCSAEADLGVADTIAEIKSVAQSMGLIYPIDTWVAFSRVDGLYVFAEVRDPWDSRLGWKIKIRPAAEPDPIPESSLPPLGGSNEHIFWAAEQRRSIIVGFRRWLYEHALVPDTEYVWNGGWRLTAGTYRKLIAEISAIDSAKWWVERRRHDSVSLIGWEICNRRAELGISAIFE